MKSISIVLILTALCFGLGCALPMPYRGRISAANRSQTHIRFVVVDHGKGENRFGFLGAGGAGKTRSGCFVKNLKDILISWNEQGVTRTARLDLSNMSLPQSDRIEITFYYEGDEKWVVKEEHSSDTTMPK